MELEIDQLDLRYAALRVRSVERDKRLLASLAEAGQIVPIVVVPADEATERLVVVDGYRRIHALCRLRREVVSAVKWELAELDALLLRRSLSMGNGETSLEQAWLCEELRQRFGLSLEELARSFDRSPSWISRRLGLVRELPVKVQELIRQGQIVPHAAAKHLVPLARANREHCERLATNIATHRLSTREVGEIYAAWRDAAPSARGHIVDDPELFLRTRRALSLKSPAALGPRTALLEDVAVIAAVSRRACRRVRDGAVGTLSAAERDEVSGALRAARVGLEQLATELSEAIGVKDARSSDEDRDLGAQQEGDIDPEDRQDPVDLAKRRAECHPNGNCGGASDRAGGARGALS